MILYIGRRGTEQIITEGPGKICCPTAWSNVPGQSPVFAGSSAATVYLLQRTNARDGEWALCCRTPWINPVTAYLLQQIQPICFVPGPGTWVKAYRVAVFRPVVGGCTAFTCP